MRTSLGRLLVMAYALLVCVSLATPSSAGGREPLTATEIVRLTGFDRALDDIASSLAREGPRLALEGGGIGDKADFALAWAAAAETAFSPAKLKSSLAARVSGKLAPADLYAVEKFFKSKLGRAMVAREVASATPEAQREMAGKAERLMKSLAANPRRIEALVAVADAIHLREASVQIALNMMRAVLIGLAASDQSQLSMPVEAIDAEIEKHRDAVVAETDAVVMLAMAFTYRTASLKDLHAYADFLRSPVGKRFYNVAMKGLDATLSEGGLVFGNLLMATLGRMPI